MSRPPYDAELIARNFDEYGEAEWNRHEATPFDRVAFHVHRHHLERFVRSGDRVLDVGAASGRFTVELARLGARITVADISQGRLDLNETNLRQAALEDHVEQRLMADVVDLSGFEDGRFDVVVCFGGPLSWVLDEADRAVDELLRVTRSGGYVLIGVMSLYGSLRAFLPGASEEIDAYGVEEMEAIVQTGFLPPPHSTLGPLHMYTWDELEALLSRHRCQIVAALGGELPIDRQRRDLRAVARRRTDVGTLPGMGGPVVRSKRGARWRDPHHRRGPRAVEGRPWRTW